MKPKLKKWNPRWLCDDLLVMVERNLVRNVRLPQLIFFSSIQPIMFLLLFTYVFGGAIKAATGSDNYIEYLLPGILVQTAVFGALQTGIGLSDDLSKGIIDRFKSLPMARSAVLGGRTVADMLRNFFVILLMIAVGHLIGFRIENGIMNAFTAFALLLYFGFAFSWVSAVIGMLVRNIETAQVAGFIWIFPLVFASSIFVPIDTMPGWLKTFAEYNPITVTADAVRGLMLGNVPPADLAVDLWQAFGAIVTILAIFVPIAVQLYRRTS